MGITCESLRPLYTSGLVKVPNMVLLFLTEEDGVTVSSMAGKLGAPMNVVSMAASKLVKGGMAERSYPFRDQRSVVLRLTPEGRAAADTMLAALNILASIAAGS